MGDVNTVAQFNVFTTEYEPLPEYGGMKAILHAATDNRRVAGSFHESGVHQMVMPFDEFIYVIAGTARISVIGGDTIELGVGGCCYLTEGQDVTFEFSEDFHDVSVLVSDTPFTV